MSNHKPIILTVLNSLGATVFQSQNYTGSVPRRREWIYLENEKKVKVPHKVQDVIWHFDKALTSPESVVIVIEGTV